MQKNADKWPILVKAGSVTVKIYSTVNRGHPMFTVSYHEAGGRRLRQFAELSKAKAEAKVIASQLSAGEGRALELTGKDRDAYLYAFRKLKPLAMPLNVVVDEYIKARGFNVPIVEACKSYAESHNAKLPERTVLQVVEEMILAKKKDGASKAYLVDLKSRLGRFSRDFRTNISDVQTADIDRWLRSRKLAPRSRNNDRNTIATLFFFAKSAGYLNRDRTTAAEHTSLARRKPEAIEVFTPEDFAKLLTAADDDTLPFFALGGFCGLRTAGNQRLNWQDIRWPESSIVISASISKTRTRRLAPLTDTAAAWLAGYKAKTGRVLPVDDPHPLVRKLCKDVGVTWPHNGLRHSFITYRLAMTKDTMRTAFEAGNSPKIIASNYNAVASEQEGKLWFSLMPTTAKNIIPLPSAKTA